MKKTISILLVITMLLSMIVVSAVPALAAEAKAEAVVGADASKAGNLLEPGANTNKYKLDSNWTAISDEAGWKAMEEGKKYYLTADITVTAVKANTPNLTIDGNGYKITASVPLFNETKTLTMQNITVDSTLTHEANGYLSALARWNSHDGAIKLYNATFNSNITSIKNASPSQYIAGIAMRTVAGSEFKNVVSNVNLTVDSADVAQLNSVAGMVGFAQETLFENCIANGTITVDKDPFKDCNNNDCGVAGLVGKATASCTFKRCTSNVDISMNAPAFSGKNDKDQTIACKSLGGIAGYATGAPFTGCLNSGSITLGDKATGWRVGGMAGHVWSSASFDGCQNEGAIKCAAADYAGGMIGHSNYSVTTVNNCTNKANVSTNGSVGSMIGCAQGNAERTVTLTDCINYGAISATKGTVGGMIGDVLNSTVLTLSDCFNCGALTAGTSKTANCYIAAMVGNAANAPTTMTNCLNIGTIKGGNATQRAPMANGTALTLTDSAYLGSSITGDVANTHGTSLSEASALRAVEATGLFINKTELLAAIERLSSLNKELFDRVAWKNMTKALEAAREVDAIKVFTVNKGAVVFADLAELQAEIDAAYAELLAVEKELAVVKATGADATTAGNLLTPGENTEKYAEDDSWTAVSNADEWAAMQADKKYYLTADITITSTKSTTKNLTIDGNGYKITSTVPLLSAVEGLTIYNLTLEATIAHNDNGYVSALAQWDSHNGAIKLYNVTSITNLTSVKNTKGNQYLSGLAQRSAAGSEFKNVVATTNITADHNDITKLTGSGGMIGRAQGTVFENCIVNGTITMKKQAFTGCNVDTCGIGGIAGQATNGTTFKNCTNNLNIVIDAPADPKCDAIGGITGYSGGASITNCINNGTITLGENATGWYVGGIAGHVSASAQINVCKNTGDITCAAASSAAGILGYSDDAVTSVSYCENRGDVSNKGYAGGVLGYADGGADKSVYVENCTNYGAASSVDAAAAGAVAGSDAVSVTVSKLLNYGAAIAAKGAAGSIIGSAADGTITVSDCLNSGAITVGVSEDDDCFAAGLVANAGNATCTIENSVSVGIITGGNAAERAPIANGETLIINNCSYLDSSITGDKANEFGNALTEAKALRAVEATHLFVNKDALVSLLDRIGAYKKKHYTEATWNALASKLEAAKAVDGTRVFTINAGVVSFHDDFDALQDAIDLVYEELCVADDALRITSTARVAVANAVSEAEKFITDNADNVYTAETWNRFTAALSAAKVIATKDDAPGDVEKAINELTASRAALVLGGQILNAADFAALEGQDGKFYLANDITISAPVKSFKGTLYANGHTVTLDGCALFEGLDGASIYDLRVEGNAGEAASIMGKASGNVTVKSIVVNTEKLAVATLFDSADAKAKIAVHGAIILSDADLAAIAGDVECKVFISNTLVMAEAPALVGKTDEASAIEIAYLDGKVFVKADGSVVTDEAVFASGEVAFIMNSFLKIYAQTSETPLAEFGALTLVQDIDKDALPKLGEAAVDGTNVVEEVLDENGELIGFRNAGDPIDSGDTAPDTEVEEEVSIDLEKLTEAINKAEALDENKYTEESFAVVKALIEAAKAALEAKTQSEADVAADALNAAVAALTEKTVKTEEKVDYTKLEVVIAKANVLKEKDYSKETWGAFQAALTLANMAKAATTQKEVDEAVAGLESAITTLKAPVGTEEPEKAPSTKPAEDSGCGSVIGAGAVMLTAIIALAGVSFKKKED